MGDGGGKGKYGNTRLRLRVYTEKELNQFLTKVQIKFFRTFFRELEILFFNLIIQTFFLFYYTFFWKPNNTLVFEKIYILINNWF